MYTFLVIFWMANILGCFFSSGAPMYLKRQTLWEAAFKDVNKLQTLNIDLSDKFYTPSNQAIQVGCGRQVFKCYMEELERISYILESLDKGDEAEDLIGDIKENACAALSEQDGLPCENDTMTEQSHAKVDECTLCENYTMKNTSKFLLGLVDFLQIMINNN